MCRRYTCSYMINPKTFVECLKSNVIDFFCGVPDSLLKNFCAYVTDTCANKHVITANEGGAVALASGHYLATGKMACVYMQNSGQGNAVNPLASLADPDVYSIPMVLLVGWRGEPGVKDEPQHVKQGKVTVSLFETLGIPTFVIPDENDEEVKVRGEGEQWKALVSSAVELARRESRPVALIVRKGLFGDYALQNKKADIAGLKREDAIEGILKALPADAVVVSTTGMISREVYETRERLRPKGEGEKGGSCHAHDFLTVGSMGHASQIALGIAMAQPKRRVFCLDGDGASIMQMGNMAIVGQSHCGNLTHIVLNNSAHDSVGGQPTVGGAIELAMIAKTLGYDVLQSPESQYSTTELTSAQVEEAVRFVLSTAEMCNGEIPEAERHPAFLEIKVAKGARKDLGRPKEKPRENMSLFMETLGVEA